MNITASAIPEVKVIVPTRHGDQRGYFCETYNRCALAEAGIDVECVQVSHSRSATRGTLRGLHFQTPPAAQAKLISVLRGRVFDVAVDLRQGSPTFGNHVSVELSAVDGNQLLCPKGFAHGFVTLEPNTEVSYYLDAYYSPEHGGGVRWDDPDLAIAWPIPSDECVLSEKDRGLPRLRDLPAYFFYAAA